MKKADVRKIVRENYSKIAKQQGPCCNDGATCCGNTSTVESLSKRIGYNEADLQAVPQGANLGLGCGNPISLVSLKEGETVLDLGSGAGFDCFLAATKVGKNGKVIGVDMTPEMIEKARGNQQKGDYDNVEFRLGEIENLPVADNSVDIIISNCVINLSPEKDRVFREAFRVLKPGGRIMVSDIVLLKEIPPIILDSIELYVSCIAGASLKADYLNTIKASGFQNVEILGEEPFSIDNIISEPAVQSIIKNLEITPEIAEEVMKSIVSVKASAFKSR